METALNTQQPTSIRALYYSFLLVEGFDNCLYLGASPFMVMGRRQDLSAGVTRAFMRANGVGRAPLLLLVYLLRNHHIRHDPIGRAVGKAFVLYQGLSTLYWYGSAQWWNEYEMKPLWYVVGWHAIWTVWATWGLLRAP